MGLPCCNSFPFVRACVRAAVKRAIETWPSHHLAPAAITSTPAISCSPRPWSGSNDLLSLLFHDLL